MANQLIFLVKITDQQLNFEKMISKYLIQEQFPFILSKKIQKLLLDLHLEISIVDWCRAIYRLIQVKVTLMSHLLIILGNLKMRKIWIQKKMSYQLMWSSDHLMIKFQNVADLIRLANWTSILVFCTWTS